MFRQTKYDTRNKGLMLVQFLQTQGMQVPSRLGSGWHSVRCYNTAGHSHGDRNRSASVNVLAGQYKCHGCGLSGDVYDLNADLTPEQVNVMFDSDLASTPEVRCSHSKCEEGKPCKLAI